jgi:hypothetical protein
MYMEYNETYYIYTGMYDNNMLSQTRTKSRTKRMIPPWSIPQPRLPKEAYNHRNMATIDLIDTFTS